MSTVIHPKTSAAGLGGALGTMIVAVLHSIHGVHLTPEANAAIPAFLAALGAFLAPAPVAETQGPPPALAAAPAPAPAPVQAVAPASESDLAPLPTMSRYELRRGVNAPFPDVPPPAPPAAEARYLYGKW